MPIYGKNFKKSSYPEPIDQNCGILNQQKSITEGAKAMENVFFL